MDLRKLKKLIDLVEESGIAVNSAGSRDQGPVFQRAPINGSECRLLVTDSHRELSPPGRQGSSREERIEGVSRANAETE